MAEVDAGAPAPVENAPAADAVIAPDAPIGQEQAQPQADESVKPKTYSEEEHRKGISERLSKERKRLERTVRAELERDFYKQQLEARSAPETPQPKGRPRQEDYAGKPYEEYIEALTDWKLEQRESKRREETQRESVEQKRAREVQEQAREVHEKILAVGQKKYPDFNDVVLADDVPISSAMVAAASRLKNGADVLYRLSKNEDELARIASLPEIEQVWEIKDYAAKLSAPPVTTKAPPPIVPNSGPAGSSKDWKDMTTEEHIKAWRNRPNR